MNILDAKFGAIDFKGQHTVTWVFRFATIFSAIISFIIGFYRQNLIELFIIYGSGVLFALLITVPPWPYLNKTPVPWLSSLKPKSVSDSAPHTASQDVKD